MQQQLQSHQGGQPPSRAADSGRSGRADERNSGDESRLFNLQSAKDKQHSTLLASDVTPTLQQATALYCRRKRGARAK